MGARDVLRAVNNSELLSYAINTNPILRAEIDLPRQGESVEKIGKLILGNERLKNAFINTINVLAATVIDRNGWDNPWTFTTRGTMKYGDSIREIILDIVEAHDYNEDLKHEEDFIKTEVPKVLNYIHHLNYQKYYKTTTSDEQLSMAFESEDGLFTFIDEAVRMLYESMNYDIYLVDKYMLCRRILDGTVPSVKIDNYENLTPRERVAKLKAVSNKMKFRSPNYNPAGLRLATPFDKQMTIIDGDFEADFSTDVLATSYFKNEAEMRIRMELIDGYASHDTERLSSLLKEAYVPFTEEEIQKLKSIRATIMDERFFQDRNYALDANQEPGKETSFYNPQTLKNNHFLHIWRMFTTSPFVQCCVLTTDDIAVTSVTIDPSEVSGSAGLDFKLESEVVTTGFANKSVFWELEEPYEGVTINQEGVVKTSRTSPSSHPQGVQGEYTVTVETALVQGDSVKVADKTYNYDSGATTATAQATQIQALFNNDENYDVTRSGAELTFKEKSAKVGTVGAPVIDDTGLATGVVEVETVQEGLVPSVVKVKATSVYDRTKYGQATITIL